VNGGNGREGAGVVKKRPNCSLRYRLVRLATRAVGGSVSLLILFWAGEGALDRCFPFPVHLLRGRGESTRILAADGTVLRVVPTPDGERMLRVSLRDVSPNLVQALIAGEDRRFYRHRGVDVAAAVRAALVNAARRRVVSGASTLTMQVVRLAEPRPRTLLAKVVEMFRARQLERVAPKEAILEAYLNLAPFGGTIRGAEAASRYWFGRRAADLTVAEAATLTAMLPAPTRRAPDRNPLLLLKCRNRVLDHMMAERMIDPAAHARAVAVPLGARRHGWPFLAPHHCDAVSLRDAGGRTVRTSLDLSRQRRVERVVRAFGGAGVDGVAVVVVARESGAVQALVGSRDYRTSPLNAACRPRAAGSTLKPFLYALAMEAGIIGPDSLLLDTRTAFRDGFTPSNFTRDFAGPIRAAEALAASRNVPAVRLLETVGVDRFRDLLVRVGLPARGRLGLDAALGTLSVTPLRLARAYAALFRPGGEAGIDAHTRARLLEILGRHSPAPELVPPEVLAWKTGTSSGRRDAWCAGVTRDRVVVVWLGNLDGRGAPDLVGGRTAARLLAAVVAAV